MGAQESFCAHSVLYIFFDLKISNKAIFTDRNLPTFLNRGVYPIYIYFHKEYVLIFFLLHYVNFCPLFV